MKIPRTLLVASLLTLGFAAGAQPRRNVQKCVGGVLVPPGTANGGAVGTDLIVDVPCTVKKGTYKYGDVNVIAPDGKLDFQDEVIEVREAETGRRRDR